MTSGLIAIFSALENCLSYSVRGDRQTKHIHLVLEPRKCLHLYHYFQHAELGLCHARCKPGFFTVDLVRTVATGSPARWTRPAWPTASATTALSGAGRRARASLAGRTTAHRLAAPVGRLLDQAHPLHREICRPIAQTYYWTASASEYATDLLFRDAPTLAALYPRLVHHGLRTFASPDVMRFLGHPVPTTLGRVHPNFKGEVISDLKHRPEGIRVNAVCPAGVMTPLMVEWANTQYDPAAALKMVDSWHPIGRMATIEEMGEVCAFLASDEAAFITGQAICPDGGAPLGYRR